MFTIFRRKKKQFNIPKKAFEAPLKHRFTFVPEGWTYYEGFTVQISGKVSTKKHAFFIASEVFREKYPEKARGSVAVYYGDAESPDVQDVLYGAYNSFEKRKGK